MEVRPDFWSKNVTHGVCTSPEEASGNVTALSVAAYRHASTSVVTGTPNSAGNPPPRYPLLAPRIASSRLNTGLGLPSVVNIRPRRVPTPSALHDLVCV
jgi:hypothetical protein